MSSPVRSHRRLRLRQDRAAAAGVRAHAAWAARPATSSATWPLSLPHSPRSAEGELPHSDDLQES
ncbi:hypothetical protein ACRJ4B_14815 [Streptomyces sp. GTA36]